MNARLLPVRIVPAACIVVLVIGLAACDDPRAQPVIPAGDVARPQDRLVLLPGPRQAVADPLVPYQRDSAAIATGKLLYAAYNCVGCHAPEGGGGMGPPFSDAEWIYGSDPESVYESIVEGRANGMPTWSGKIPEDEIWRIVAYVRSLSPPPVPTDIPPQRGAERDTTPGAPSDTTRGVANDTTPADNAR
jgi:cytochrome c oxidase cbb3-type subunit 3